MNVICPEHVKTIHLDPEWRAEVTVRQKLVFLDARQRGSVRDTCEVEAGAEADSFTWRSDDATETGRRKKGRTTVVVDWKPRTSPVPFALYEHQYTWNPKGAAAAPALSTELCCGMKTGLFQCEIVAQNEFEAAVVFERPRWPLLNTERKLIRYALKQMDASSERPTIGDGGRHIEWKLVRPKVGARFILVVFRRHGVAVWQDQLQKSTLIGRARQFFGRLTSSAH